MDFGGPKPLMPAFFIFTFLIACIFSACSNQEPAFKEERSSRFTSDAKVATGGAGASTEMEEGLADTETGIKDDVTNGGDSSGTQYIKAAQKTGGMIQSICESNWSVSLGKLGYDLNAQLTQIVLPSAPDVPTIKLKVNDVLVTGWTFNEGNNAVKFNSSSVPAEGARIQVDYIEAQKP
jgi:hypothetical protein